jgi:hypothetical protein
VPTQVIRSTVGHLRSPARGVDVVSSTAKVPAREVGGLTLLGNLADDAYLAVRHVAKSSMTDEDRSALEQVQSMLTALSEQDRQPGRPKPHLRRMAAVEAAATLLEEGEETSVDAIVLEKLVSALDRVLAAGNDDEDLDLLAKVFERFAVASLEAADDLLRPMSPRGRWSAATTNS